MRFLTTGLILLGVASMAACAAETGDDSGTGGAGTGGTVSGAGGAVGAGGTTTGAGGTTTGAGGTTTGAGGTTAGTGGGSSGTCVSAGTTSAVIADFEGGTDPVISEVDGRKGVFVTTPTGGTSTVTGGALNAKTTSGSWATTGTVIADAECYNATAASYAGVKFTISSPTNTSIKFALTTKETSGTDAGGTCVPVTDVTACSDHPAKTVAVTSTPTSQCVLFSQLAAGGWGGTAAPLPTPENHILGFAWGVLESAETLDLTLDNIEFVTSCP